MFIQRKKFFSLNHHVLFHDFVKAEKGEKKEDKQDDSSVLEKILLSFDLLPPSLNISNHWNMASFKYYFLKD